MVLYISDLTICIICLIALGCAVLAYLAAGSALECDDPPEIS
jgi:hypothetical protein